VTSSWSFIRQRALASLCIEAQEVQFGVHTCTCEAMWMRLLCSPSHIWILCCEVSNEQVFPVVICITKAYEVVSCAEMYAVSGCEC